MAYGRAMIFYHIKLGYPAVGWKIALLAPNCFDPAKYYIDGSATVWTSFGHIVDCAGRGSGCRWPQIECPPVAPTIMGPGFPFRWSRRGRWGLVGSRHAARCFTSLPQDVVSHIESFHSFAPLSLGGIWIRHYPTRSLVAGNPYSMISQR